MYTNVADSTQNNEMALTLAQGRRAGNVLKGRTGIISIGAKRKLTEEAEKVASS